MNLPGGLVEQVLVCREIERLMRPNHDYEIVAAREVMLHETKSLAHEALDAIASHRVADLAPDAQSKTRVIGAIGLAVYDQRAQRLATASAVDGLELPRVRESAGASEGVSPLFGHVMNSLVALPASVPSPGRAWPGSVDDETMSGIQNQRRRRMKYAAPARMKLRKVIASTEYRVEVDHVFHGAFIAAMPCSV